MSTSQDAVIGPVETSIRQKLTEILEPSVLDVQNDSWKHRHHKAMQEKGGVDGETHFSITVVSNAFREKTLMQRHRMIYGALADELREGLHALSLVTKTPEETSDTMQ
ncbi:bola-like protein [Fomitiporia mediterranea MF3/22]|uniref:bola-like protein n=1 Tax=Fomitiporia mediterranea (strain MF3/22) TaxID=694068 RepID=UPI000440935D|nr:bola-like protein [Fomitiporia mediterranea MF3/22]EJD03126.1 bola-like protein [Fomitiporia mediterranea MF3/22]